MADNYCERCGKFFESEEDYGTNTDGSINKKYCDVCLQNGEFNIRCQSCAVPIDYEDEFGTNMDGSLNNDYCIQCYQNGKFIEKMTLNEFIEKQIETAESIMDIPEDKMKKIMKNVYSKLKRWKQ